jgi:hypothetical protein
MNSFVIHCDELKPENIVSQLRAIKDFPAVIKIYDRTFTITNRDEIVILCNGIEIGYFCREEAYEKENI